MQCKLCKKHYDYQSGHFSKHLKSDHFMSKEQYFINVNYNGIRPKCECGYCTEYAKFNERTNIFYKINIEHRNFQWVKTQYLTKYFHIFSKFYRHVYNFYINTIKTVPNFLFNSVLTTIDFT